MAFFVCLSLLVGWGLIPTKLLFLFFLILQFSKLTPFVFGESLILTFKGWFKNLLKEKWPFRSPNPQQEASPATAGPSPGAAAPTAGPLPGAAAPTAPTPSPAPAPGAAAQGAAVTGPAAPPGTAAPVAPTPGAGPSNAPAGGLHPGNRNYAQENLNGQYIPQGNQAPPLYTTDDSTGDSDSDSSGD